MTGRRKAKSTIFGRTTVKKRSLSSFEATFESKGRGKTTLKRMKERRSDKFLLFKHLQAKQLLSN
jgi:hypothetical protein